MHLYRRVYEQSSQTNEHKMKQIKPRIQDNDSPPVTVLVQPVALQPDDDEGHDGLDDAELERGLLAEAQEPDVVGVPGQAARAVHPAGLDGLAADLRHDVALPAEVLVAQSEEVVDHEG